MWSRLKALVPGADARRKLVQGAVVAGVAAAAFCWGRQGATSPAAAQHSARHGETRQAVPAGHPEYANRVVAFIHGNIPISREELGEYLIARFGAERLEFLVNRRIIDLECQKRRIGVTDAEVDAQQAADLKVMGVSEKDFVNSILKRYNKTLFEYREDVIRPKLALQKMCVGLVKVDDDDLKKAFEAHYGEKVRCRMIVLQKEVARQAADIWAKVRDSEEEFDKAAKSQFIPALAAKAGEIPPIHKHFPDPKIEKAAFELKRPGEITAQLPMEDGTIVILKMVHRIPPDQSRRYNEERSALYREVYDAKLAATIPHEFAKMRATARPEMILRREITPEEQDRQVQEQIKDVKNLPVPPGAFNPRGH